MKSKPPILNKLSDLSDKESENKKDFVSDATKHVPLQSNLYR